ncbi:hypothetical protein TBR22_A12710 [Luteitalea sp. TBR-22]|uniref:hypothetical protein n=1 Tax=Luteitalea sp. TBR-22 TaxID=2802971 RepID=UPI001AFB48EE|nr:hypothetical protein [Luteitalea sp. TBR-22]BCS32066.1 hypothetical protein TBR22_A12710 [Luteitalea sp. TBR-22]
MVRSVCQSLLVLVTVAVFSPTLAAPAWAQSLPAPDPPVFTSPSQVISGNPFGFLVNLVNAEYERRAGPGVTVGVGGSRGDWGAMNGRAYVNGDVFVRYYPGGQAFKGRSFGVKAGMTQFPGDGGSYFGIGVDANQTWMLNPHFAFSTGFGLKRLIGMERNEGPLFIPTLRINLGIGF